MFGSKSGITKKSQDVIEGNTINNSTVMAAFGKSNVEESRLNKVYEFYARGIADLLSPNQILSSYVKDQIRRDKDDKLKAFLLKVLQTSDFNIVDFDLKEEEVPITPNMGLVIKNTPMPENAREEMLKKALSPMKRCLSSIQLMEINDMIYRKLWKVGEQCVS